MIKKSLDSTSLILHTAEKIELTIRDLFVETGVSYEFTNDLKGIEMDFSTTAGNTFGSATATNVATGIDIDFSTLNITSGATSEIVGLRVDMGQQTGNEERICGDI